VVKRRVGTTPLVDSGPLGEGRPGLRRQGTIVDHVLELIGKDIVSGRMKPDQKLSEPELARRFGTSRGPVREAIRRLEERKLVVRKPNAGARVAPITAQNIIDLYYLREALEGMVARLAAKNITEAEIAEAHRILEYQQEVWENREPGEIRYREANLAFHELIRKASRNELLVQQLSDDWHFLSRLWLRQHPEFPMRGDRAIEDHYRVLHALEERDAELAEILMRRHIANTRRRYEVIAAGGRLVGEGSDFSDN
jgi:DNA-binding GntR family transcriptional regulator